MSILEENQCGTCGEITRDYRRKLSSGMARWLSVLVDMAGPQRGWVQASDVNEEMPGPRVGSDATALLPHWGLIESCPYCDKRGSWRPTTLGRDFALGLESVDRYIVTRDKECLGLRGPRVFISEVAGDDFDLDELLGKDRRTEALFCTGCEKQGRLKVISRHTLRRAREENDGRFRCKTCDYHYVWDGSRLVVRKEGSSV